MNQLKNTMEEMVLQYVSEHISNTGICECENCRLDITAIMLNKLQPHYVVTDEGVLLARVKQCDFQYKVDIAIAMTEAVEIVKNKPRHNIKHR